MTGQSWSVSILTGNNFKKDNAGIMISFSRANRQIYSYLALRRTVGWIGILLPFVLMGGSHFLFGEEVPLFDISMYYYSGMRDVFVGAMCAVGLFLLFYRGYDRWDNLAADVAGICAFVIAWFPATKTGPQDWAGQIHFGAAGVFFAVLALFSLFLFTRGKRSHAPEDPTQCDLHSLRDHPSSGSPGDVCLFPVFAETVPSYPLCLLGRNPGPGILWRFVADQGGQPFA